MQMLLRTPVKAGSLMHLCSAHLNRWFKVEGCHGIRGACPLILSKK